MEAQDDEIPTLVDENSLFNSANANTGAIPVTILTGFLGSGKSTLLNYILREPHGKRIAVIENELSSGLGIESMLVKSGVDGSSLAGFFELSNGCICCTVKDDLISTLEQLVLHKDRFDYLLIETTGVANPGPVIASFWQDDELGAKLQLDGVITVIDSVNLLSCLSSAESAEETRLQIAYADRILINKCDIFQGDISSILHRVSSMNSAADIRQTSFSKVAIDWVLDIKAYGSDASQVLNMHLTGDSTHICGCNDNEHEHEHTHDHEHDHEHMQVHPAGKLFTHGFTFRGSVDPMNLQRFVGSLMWDNPTGVSIYRMKGIFRCVGAENLFVLQSVHELLELQESSYDLSVSDVNKLIVIGKEIDVDMIQKGLESCVVESQDHDS